MAMTPDEREDGGRVQRKLGTAVDRQNPQLVGEIVDKALSHCFERDSVVPERSYLREALRRSFGHGAGGREIRRAKGGGAAGRKEVAPTGLFPH